jgi:hypothetical protein
MNEKQKSTLARVQSMLQAGMEQISGRELEIRLESIGYKLGDSFCYENNLNAGEFWKAKSFGIIEKSSGLSFAHVDAPKKNLKALQEIRFNCFVFQNGRIWEI